MTVVLVHTSPCTSTFCDTESVRTMCTKCCVSTGNWLLRLSFVLIDQINVWRGIRIIKLTWKMLAEHWFCAGLLWKEQSDSGNYHLKINNLISHLHVIVFFFFFLIWNLTISVNFSLLLLWLLFCWYIFVVFFPFWSLFRCMPLGRAHVCIWNCVRSTCIWPL